MQTSQILPSAMGKNNPGRFAKVFHDEIGLRLQLLGITKIDEYRAHAGAFAAIDVAPAITDHPRAGKVETEGCGGIEQHARLWLAATRWFALAGIIADFDAID